MRWLSSTSSAGGSPDCAANPWRGAVSGSAAAQEESGAPPENESVAGRPASSGSSRAVLEL